MERLKLLMCAAATCLSACAPSNSFQDRLTIWCGDQELKKGEAQSVTIPLGVKVEGDKFPSLLAEEEIAIYKRGVGIVGQVMSPHGLTFPSGYFTDIPGINRQVIALYQFKGAQVTIEAMCVQN